MPAMGTTRLDKLVVERGLVESREKAQRLIMAGKVFVDGQKADKAGRLYDSGVTLTVAAREPYVSRGGLKLAHALRFFGLDVRGLVCLDSGASTGGFTDCLLQNGARQVFAVDVGKGLLHETLRRDPRVVAKDGLNARYLKEEHLGGKVDAAVVDVSFISLTKVLPAVKDVVKPGGWIVTLIKPQFEAGREAVGRGGVVRNPAVRAAVVEQVRQAGTSALNLEWQGVCESPIQGPAGNIEFLALWKRR